MASQRLEPPTHQPATIEEMQKISDDLNYRCSPEQLQAMTNIVSETLSSLKLLDSLCDPVPEVKYPRTPGYRPKPEDRCGNAWAWRCDIQGASSGKLAGKTIAIKDNVAVAGVPMSNGSLLLEGYTPEYDASVITRILDAGGRILGKSGCDDFCFSTIGFSSVDGYISNVDNPEFCIGGSSGGSAVLVARREVDLAIAGDQGGSIRIPAACTGTVGLKPTHGLVPYTGIVSIEPTLDHVGPIAPDVAGCAVLLEVIAGIDGLDGRQVLDAAVPEYSSLLEEDVSGKVLGVLNEGFEICTQETQTAVKEFLAKAGEAGFIVKDVSVPLHKYGIDLIATSFSQGAQAMLQLGTSGQFLKGFYPTSLEKAVRQGFHSSAGVIAPGLKLYSMYGELLKRRYGNHYYCKARNITLELSHQYEEALSQCDVIVMPTMPHTAPKFLQKGATELESHEAFLNRNLGMIKNTVAADLTGHPALSLPLGKLGDGSTDSLMIVGHKFDDLTVLQVARALEKIIPARN